MVTFVLDASAVLRFVESEAGGLRVKAIFRSKVLREASVEVSAVHWGEVVGILLKRYGSVQTMSTIGRLHRLCDVVPVTAVRAERCALLRLKYGVPHVDSFALELTGSSIDRTLVTADFDFKPAEADFQIEFLPAKVKP